MSAYHKDAYIIHAAYILADFKVQEIGVVLNYCNAFTDAYLRT